MTARWPPARRQAGVAIGLGSVRTRVRVLGRGPVPDVPTVTFPGSGTGSGPESGSGTGALHPVRHRVVDVPGTARMLDRLLRHRLPRISRPPVVLTAPVSNSVAHRSAARAAVDILRPRAVLTVSTARTVARAAREDPSRPLLVGIGAHVTETVLLVDGTVTEAHRATPGAADLGTAPGAAALLVDSLVAAVATYGSRTGRRRRPPPWCAVSCRPAVGRRAPRWSTDPSLAQRGGIPLGAHPKGLGADTAGAGRRARRLDVTVRVVPAPHSAAVRGAAELLETARRHPSFTGGVGPPARDRPAGPTSPLRATSP
ncbi:hypothetical protein PV392_23090 [Streptomyces sp. ME03-5709C]|nr:hypothetical protein [Streptomyces sp. ME03-5709C]